MDITKVPYTGALFPVNLGAKSFTSGKHIVNISNAADKGIAIKGIAGQTGNYLQISDSNNIDILDITPANKLRLNPSTSGILNNDYSNYSSNTYANLNLSNTGAVISRNVSGGAGAVLTVKDSNASFYGPLILCYSQGTT